MRCNLQWQKYEIEWTVKVEKFEMKVPRFIEKNVDLARVFEHSSICANFFSENLRWKYFDFWER